MAAWGAAELAAAPPLGPVVLAEQAVSPRATPDRMIRALRPSAIARPFEVRLLLPTSSSAPQATCCMPR